MGLKEDLIDIKKEVKEVKGQSLAMELLKESRQANKRICFCFTAVIMLLIVLSAVQTIYIIHLLNDIGIEETTTETYELIGEGNNNFVKGDNSGEINN